MNELIEACIVECQTCMEACRKNAEICREEGGHMMSCAEACSECANACEKNLEMLREGTTVYCDECAQACQACADACQQHGDRHEHCRVTGEISARCAERCREVTEGVTPS